MKKLLLIFLIGITCIAFSVSARAATPADIETAINKGITWLVNRQQADGSWNDGYGNVAATGLILVKLCDRAYELGLDPFDDDPASTTYFPYATNVIKGFDWLFSKAQTGASGVNFLSGTSYNTYCTGIAMMAVSSSRTPARQITTGPLNGQTYQQALQSMMDWMSFAQIDSGCGVGGWGYYANHPSGSDNSISGYATLGVGFAATAPPTGFGISIPASVLTGLNTFVNNYQVASGAYAGGSIYSCSYGSAWVNILKTGNLLYEMALVGRDKSNATVQSAVAFIQNYWGTSGGEYNGAGWIGDYQAMFTLMKGLESQDIKEITVSGSPIDWFDQVSTYIVQHQSSDGSWTGTTGEARSAILSTPFALLTLEKVVGVVDFGIPSQCVAAGQEFKCFNADSYVIVGTPPYTWTWSGEVNLSLSIDADNNICITYPAGWTGSETIIFTVTDANNISKTDEATFTVDPVPVVSGIPDQVAPFVPFDLDNYLSGVDPSAVTWSYSGNTCLQVSIDAENVATVTNPGLACKDPELITFTAMGTACTQEVSSSDSATFTPNRPPDCAKAYASPGCLFPPNNQYPMKPVNILGVTDPDGDPVAITILSITSDEPTATVKGAGGPLHAPDAYGVGTSSAMIRAERSGLLDGRVYVINFMAEDGKGGVCSGSVVVNVPHDWSVKSCPAVDSGQKYDATKIN